MKYPLRLRSPIWFTYRCDECGSRHIVWRKPWHRPSPVVPLAADTLRFVHELVTPTYFVPMPTLASYIGMGDKLEWMTDDLWDRRRLPDMFWMAQEQDS